MTAPTAVSLFAGIGGFDLAFARAGWNVTAAVEIDTPACGVISDRLPGTHLFTDVCEVTADGIRATGFDPRNGVLCAGWPCQDLSVSGNRAGLGGERSGLFWQVVRLLADLHPRWFCLENVPGLLSSVCPSDDDAPDNSGGGYAQSDIFGTSHGDGLTRGRGACPGGCMAAHGGAMGLVLGALAQCGYGVAYRVLDAQYFGVPQQRSRVVFVGHLGDWAAPVEVLLEPEGSLGDPRPAPAPRQRNTAAVAPRAGSGSGPMGAADAGRVIATTVTARYGKGPDSDATQTLVIDEATTILGKTVTHTLTAQSDGMEDGSGRGTPLVGYEVRNGDVVEIPAVRRLSPLECERLQGFPDQWTATSWGRPQSDAARYRQIGNAIAVPVFERVARRMIQHTRGEQLA